MTQNQTSCQVAELEKENFKLREQVRLLYEALEQEPTKKPKNCIQCMHFVQHYIFSNERFDEVNSGHCTRGGSKPRRLMKQDETCKFFELGTYEMKWR